jgi:uncharacterized FlaG/YvyC family protein
MPAKPEFNQTAYLAALCRMMKQPGRDQFHQESGDFQQLVNQPLHQHLRNEARSYPQIDLNFIYDQTIDIFGRHLSERPNKYKRIVKLFGQLLLPPKLEDSFAEGLSKWTTDTWNWANREMTVCNCNQPEFASAKQLNKEMEPLQWRGDDFLEWICSDVDELSEAGSGEDFPPPESADDEESVATPEGKQAKARRNRIAKRASAIAKLLMRNNASVVDQQIGMEYGAVFSVETDEVIRLLPSIRLPFYPLLKTIGSRAVWDAIRKIKAYHEAIEKMRAAGIDIAFENGEESESPNPSIDEILLQPGEAVFIEDSLSHPTKLLTKREVRNWIKCWKVYVYETSQMKGDELSKAKTFKEGTRKIIQTWLHQKQSSQQQNGGSPRSVQVQAYVMEDLAQAEANLNQLLERFNALDPQSATGKKELQVAIDKAQKERDLCDLCKRVLETLLEGFKLVEQNQFDTDVAPITKRGYSQKQIAEKLGLVTRGNKVNEEEVKKAKEYIAKLLLPLFPNQLRSKHINTHLEYFKRLKTKMGNAMPDLPDELDSDEWLDVIHWVRRWLDQEIAAESFKFEQAKEKLAFLDGQLERVCHYANPAGFDHDDLQKLLDPLSEANAKAISTRYRVALDIVESLFQQRGDALREKETAYSERRKAKKRSKELREALNQFKKTRGSDHDPII